MMQCIIARYEPRMRGRQRTAAMDAGTTRRASEHTYNRHGALLFAKQQGLAACKTLASRLRSRRNRASSTVVVREQQGPGRARRRAPAPRHRRGFYAHHYRRPRLSQSHRLYAATPTRTCPQTNRRKAPAKLSSQTYWKCVDGRDAANVLLNFFSGARTMRCGSGNLRPALAYWIVAGRFKSASFSTTPVRMIWIDRGRARWRPAI